jgi:hypothetical protein
MSIIFICEPISHFKNKRWSFSDPGSQAELVLGIVPRLPLLLQVGAACRVTFPDFLVSLIFKCVTDG